MKVQVQWPLNLRVFDDQALSGLAGDHIRLRLPTLLVGVPHVKARTMPNLALVVGLLNSRLDIVRSTPSELNFLSELVRFHFEYLRLSVVLGGCQWGIRNKAIIIVPPRTT